MAGNYCILNNSFYVDAIVESLVAATVELESVTPEVPVEMVILSVGGPAFGRQE